MSAFHVTRRAAGLVAAVVLLSACAAGTSSPAAPSASETATAGTSPIVFTVVATCESGGPAPTAVPKPHPDAIWGVCEQTATDPRQSGTWEGYVRFEGDPTDEWVMSSTGTLTNDGGSWACQDFGRALKGLAVADGVCVGQDGYEGLTAYGHSVSDDSTATQGSFGWIIENP